MIGTLARLPLGHQIHCADARASSRASHPVRPRRTGDGEAMRATLEPHGLAHDVVGDLLAEAVEGCRRPAFDTELPTIRREPFEAISSSVACAAAVRRPSRGARRRSAPPACADTRCPRSPRAHIPSRSWGSARRAWARPQTCPSGPRRGRRRGCLRTRCSASRACPSRPASSGGSPSGSEGSRRASRSWRSSTRTCHRHRAWPGASRRSRRGVARWRSRAAGESAARPRWRSGCSRCMHHRPPG